MRFPPQFIERLRSHFLMSEVIGRRIAVKKHGREFQALCPFHNEKTPSFTINDEKGFYHCFGCGAHGDAIEFIRKFERLSYPETIETLAREAGIPLPELTREEAHKIEQAKTHLDVLDAASQWFEKQLIASSGMVARDYVEKRGLKLETLRQFRIGYAPDERTALYNHLKTAGFSQTLMMDAGLIITPEDGPPYDRFRGRVMFPIRNASGKIIAFGGRLIINTTNKNLPKYLNSPETALFKKGEVLYNLDLAKKPARDGNMVAVMEGYMDVVSTWQSGVNVATATLGTAVTPEHLRLLWQLAKEPVLCLDGDAAGQRAMQRAAEIALPLLKPGYSLRFAILPKGDDPDSFVQKHGKAAFEKILTGGRRLEVVLWEEEKRLHNPKAPGNLAVLQDKCKKLSEAIADPAVKNYYRHYFNGHIAYHSKQLWEQNRSANKNEKPRSAQVEQMAAQNHSAALEALAQRALFILIKFPALLHKSRVEETLSHLAIGSAVLDMLRNVLVAAHHHTDIDNHEVFMEYVEEQMHGDMPASLHDKLALPYPDTFTAEDAFTLWNETISAYEEERELAVLEESVKQDWNEANCQRLVELKQKRASRTFAPAEPDAA